MAELGEVRSFVAVPLPRELQGRVFAAAEELARALPESGIRWSRKVENLHVTLKFLGDLGEDRLAALGADLKEALAARPRFRIELRRMGAFPSGRHASVLWADVDDVEGGLAATAAAVEAVAERHGLAREQRPFRGHVTVGRAKRGREHGIDARAALAAFLARDFGEVTVTEVHVYESRLGGGPGQGDQGGQGGNLGSTYILRSRAALGAATFN